MLHPLRLLTGTRAARDRLRHGRTPSWRAGFSVRVDWPDGTHSFAGFRTDLYHARRLAERICHPWGPRPVAGGYWRPTALNVVAISKRDWGLHSRRHECRSPSCPHHIISALEVARR